MKQQTLKPKQLFINIDEISLNIIYDGIIIRFSSFIENNFQYQLYNSFGLIITIPKHQFIIENLNEYFLLENTNEDLCNPETIKELN